MGKSCRHKFSLCANCIANQVSPITLVRTARRNTYRCDVRTQSAETRCARLVILLISNHERYFFLLPFGSFVRFFILHATSFCIFAQAFGRQAQSTLILFKMQSIRFFVVRLIFALFFFPLFLIRFEFEWTSATGHGMNAPSPVFRYLHI